MTHAEKIAFWQKVMDYAHDRGIEVWWYVWNIHVYGSEDAKYGLTDSPTNAITKDYIRKAVTQLFLTYPKLTGLGMCPGENFADKNKDHDFKEQWCWDVYGEGILDYKKINPARKIGFVHRYWLTDFKYIGNRFNKLSDGFDLEYKYSKARLYSAPKASLPALEGNRFVERGGTAGGFLPIIGAQSHTLLLSIVPKPGVPFGNYGSLSLVRVGAPVESAGLPIGRSELGRPPDLLALFWPCLCI